MSNLDPDARPQPAGAFSAMASAYFLGTFNDNLYKQAVMLLAVLAGREGVQGIAGAAFTLPFVLFAAPAGWLADRFPKRRVVIGAKTVELGAAMVGAWGLLAGRLELMVLMVALMGTQATFFSPALNGAIPELFPPGRVTRANALLRLFVTVGILAGIALAGLLLGMGGAPILGAGRGRTFLSFGVIGVALFGLLVSLAIPGRPPADPGRPFPWAGPLDTLRELRRVWADRLLGRVLIADVFIWSIGVYQLLVINSLGLRQFRLGESVTSLLVACQLLGLALGGLLAARLAHGERWFRVLVPAGFGMGLAMGAIGLIPHLPDPLKLTALFGGLGAAGLTGGLILIPCESFLQVRPAPERKGAVWASANFASFLGMALASGAYGLLKDLRPTQAYALLGAVSLGFTAWLAGALREFRSPGTR